MSAPPRSAKQHFIEALNSHGCTLKEYSGSIQAQCPAHDDNNPSLSITDRRDHLGIVIHCHAGCEYRDILTALNLTEYDLFDDTNLRDALAQNKDYFYSNGRINHRGVNPDGSKKFWQEGASDHSLYKIESISPTGPVYLCEGEKAVDFLRSLGHNAVATGGSNHTCDLTPLQGRDVIAIADRDESGYKWAIKNMSALLAAGAASVQVVQAKPKIPKSDVVEHIAAGFELNELETVIDKQTQNGHATIDPFEIKVAWQLDKLKVDTEAKRRLEDELRPGAIPPPPKSLTALLAEPDTTVRYRIDKLAPAEGRVLLSAQYKAGKTIIVGNLLRSLADGDPFLGQFDVDATSSGKTVLIDTELSENTLRAWLRDQDISNTDHVADVIPLRGKLTAFDLLDDRHRTEWANRLADLGCDYLILDCLRPLLDAFGLDEHRNAGQFLTAYDALLNEAGVTDSLIVHHMGHTGERARGDSRLQDWPDAIWRVVREDENPGSPRFFSAYGRDVDVFEGRLTYDQTTRRLTYTPGSRLDSATESAYTAVIDLLVESSPLSKHAIEQELKGDHTQKAIRAAITKATENDVLTSSIGARGAHLHELAHPCSVCGKPVISGGGTHLSCGLS